MTKDDFVAHLLLTADRFNSAAQNERKLNWLREHFTEQLAALARRVCDHTSYLPDELRRLADALLWAETWGPDEVVTVWTALATTLSQKHGEHFFASRAARHDWQVPLSDEAGRWVDGKGDPVRIIRSLHGVDQPDDWLPPKDAYPPDGYSVRLEGLAFVTDSYDDDDWQSQIRWRCHFHADACRLLAQQLGFDESEDQLLNAENEVRSAPWIENRSLKAVESPAIYAAGARGNIEKVKAGSGTYFRLGSVVQHWPEIRTVLLNAALREMRGEQSTAVTD